MNSGIMYIASSNKGKIKEFQEILYPYGITVSAHPGFASLNTEETGETFEENASIKAVALSGLTGGFAVADDSGLAVEALGGDPGIRSARYAGEKASDQENNRLLLINMKGVADRRAKFICVIALAFNREVKALFRGECEGIISENPRGDKGFGYDPLFLLSDGRTMAELSVEEKNRISHRRKAIDKLIEYVVNEFIKE